ncbi:MAG: hypothetical protein LCH73_16440 [Proteobacteria bacterium]|nr:hypothetical protein [Pseudomonadota bacterium]
MFNRKQAALLLAASLLAVGAQAKVLTSGAYGANFTFSTASPKTPVPLTSTGATSITFNAAKAGTYVLAFSAECSADNGTTGTGGWVDIDVEVNGAIISPTIGGLDAFCSPNGTVGHDGWVRAAITMPIKLVAGSNTIRVLGGINSGVTSGWLGDTATVVDN